MAASNTQSALACGSPLDRSMHEWQMHMTTKAAESHGQPNIWKQMAYTPPRGPCAYKASLMTPACACLRFMIHPVKAATSFECDGCGHHASFHKMENPSEEECVKRWSTVDGYFDREAYSNDEEVLEVLAKRRKLGIKEHFSSFADVAMPEKAKATLMGDESSRKRTRVEGLRSSEKSGGKTAERRIPRSLT